MYTQYIPTFILPDYTYLPAHNSAPGQIHTTSNMTYPGTMARPQVIPGYDLRPNEAASDDGDFLPPGASKGMVERPRQCESVVGGQLLPPTYVCMVAWS